MLQIYLGTGVVAFKLIVKIFESLFWHVWCHYFLYYSYVCTSYEYHANVMNDTFAAAYLPVGGIRCRSAVTPASKDQPAFFSAGRLLTARFVWYVFFDIAVALWSVHCCFMSIKEHIFLC